MQIPITRKSIKEEISKHPESNSLLAISDVLDYWHVPNAAYQVTFEELIAADLTTCFIVYFPNQMRHFAFVNQIDNNKVVIVDERDRKQQLSIEDFKEMYRGGAVLVAEKGTESGEKDYRKKDGLWG